MTVGFAICAACAHYRGDHCTAFPGGIPDDILSGGFDHRRQFDGEDVLFKLEPGREAALASYEQLLALLDDEDDDEEDLEDALDAQVKFLAQVETKHGDKGEPGYELLHPNLPRSSAQALDPEKPLRSSLHFATDEERREVGKRLGKPIPPAWRHVQVANDPTANLQVVGEDAYGRTQYRYSREYVARKAAEKFERVKRLSEASEKVDEALERDYEDPRAGALVMMRYLGLRTGGNRKTGAKERAHGATNMLAAHASVDEDGVTTVEMTGKHGKRTRLVSNHPLVAKTVKHHLQGKSPDDPLFGVRPKEAERYLRSVERGFKLKDLRTSLGTAFAARELQNYPPPLTEAERKATKKAVVAATAKMLGNTPDVALRSYINPVVWREWSGDD